MLSYADIDLLVELIETVNPISVDRMSLLLILNIGAIINTGVTVGEDARQQLQQQTTRQQIAEPQMPKAASKTARTANSDSIAID